MDKSKVIFAFCKEFLATVDPLQHQLLQSLLAKRRAMFPDQRAYDDINKFLWMVRIAQGVWPDEIQEPNYFTPQGEYRVDDRASDTMKNSLMYKMSYYR